MFKSLFELSTVRHNATSLMGPSSSRRKSGGGAFVPVVEQPPVEQSETSFVVEVQSVGLVLLKDKPPEL